MARAKMRTAAAEPVEGPWALPDGWRWERLSDAAEICDYLRRPINNTERRKRNGGKASSALYPYYGATGQAGVIDDYLADGDFILLGEDGAPFLEPFKAKAYSVSGRFWVNNHAHVLKGRAHLDQRILLHWLNTINYEPFVNGTTRLKLTQGAMVDMPVPIPPADYQPSLISRIDALFAEVEDADAALARARADLGTWRKTLLKAAVTGELTADWRVANPPQETGTDLLARMLTERRTRWHAEPRNRGKRYVEPAGPDTDDIPELPEGWAWALTGQVVRQAEYGTSVKCGEVKSGPPVLRMGNIQDGGLDWRKLKYAPEGKSVPSLAKGDVLFNRTNSAELLGKSAVFDGADAPVSFASYLVAVRLDNVLPHYFSAWMNSIYGRKWVAENKSQQVGQANLSAGTLMRMPLPIPSLHEQAEIVALLAADRERDDALTIEVGEIADGSATLRQSILAAAFRGDLVA